MGLDLESEFKIISRASNGGQLVIRPDSGEPKEIVVKILNTLAKRFIPTVNSKGYKELPKHVRIIQGDGITHKTVGDILEAMKVDGYGIFILK